jgi:tRNA(Ile)-lysidine synthase
LGAAIDYPSTEALRSLALTGHAGQKLQLAQGLCAERTPRELRLMLAAEAGEQGVGAAAEYRVTVPGEVTAFGVRLRIERIKVAAQKAESTDRLAAADAATLRNWRPGDRVRLRHSSGPRKVKEVLERLRVTGASRALWPVLEVEGRIVWMRGVELEPTPGILVVSSGLENDGRGPSLLGSSGEE